LRLNIIIVIVVVVVVIVIVIVTYKETKESTLGKYSLVSLMQHVPSDLGLICEENKRKIHFQISESNPGFS